ncbi:MAG: HlyD family efflux transporter periplasmic adaptor subunit, partial [bacterium]|nr:HlyD family efflux transporter periplasmic adaptor subunit [bacterium]
MTLVAVMSGNFKVEAFVPEVDVAKITVGNQATITLDAYGSDVSFNASVVKIDPAETVIDGVSTYKTTLEFDKDDPRIRSGMTANTTIISAKRDNVLALPQRTVYEKNGKKFVRVVTGSDTLEEREVTVGIRGSNGDIEILSGLKQGDNVATSGK